MTLTLICQMAVARRRARPPPTGCVGIPGSAPPFVNSSHVARLERHQRRYDAGSPCITARVAGAIMLVVSVCPYCSRGRVRLPEEDIGTTAKCPSCGSEFTVIPTEEPVAAAAGAVGSSTAVFAEDTVPRRSAPVPVEPPAAETLPDAKPVPADVDTDDLPDPARLPAMIAVAVALAGVVAWMIPDFGRLVWLGLAVVAVGIGGWSFLAADWRRLFAWIALGVSGGSLLLCLALPWMFGEGWWPARGYNADDAVAVGANGEQTDGRKPIDATKAVWFTSAPASSRATSWSARFPPRPRPN